MAAREEYESAALKVIGRHDHVRVPDGRIGEVMGFCGGDGEPVLVAFAKEDSQRYFRADLRLVWRRPGSRARA